MVCLNVKLAIFINGVIGMILGYLLCLFHIKRIKLVRDYFKLKKVD